MRRFENVVEAIGRTPLIRLKRASEETGCTILGKAEFLNPGQSVKDRAALYIIKDAVTSGRLRPGGTIVEGTAGNTGIGLTVVGNALGYKTVIVIPNTQSQEKKDALRLLGAELIEVPAVPYANPNNYVKYSGRLAEAMAKHQPGRRHLGEPVRQRRQPARPCRDDGAGDLGGDRRQGRTVQLRRRHRRHHRRRFAWPEALRPNIRVATRRPAWRGAATVTTRRACSKPKARRSPKASARAASPATSKARRSITPTGSTMPRRSTSSSSWSRGRPVPRLVERHQHRRGEAACPRTRPRPHRRDGAVRFRLALSVQAVQPANFCAGKGCRCPAWLEPRDNAIPSAFVEA